MKKYENTKLISDSCMAGRSYAKLTGGLATLSQSLNTIRVTHENGGKISLTREEAINLKLFIEEALGQEF